MKILFLLESTTVSDEFLYYRALVNALAADGYEPKIVFTTKGTPSDHTFQLVKDHVVHNFTKLLFRSGDAGYGERLARHIDKNEYDFVVVSQSVFPGNMNQPVVIKDVFGMMASKPQLIFVGNQCSQSVTQAAADLAPLEPKWAAVSQNIASRFMPDHDVQVVYGPAVQPKAKGVDIRADFGIRKDMKMLGFIGNVDDVNMEPVLEACRRMKVGLLIAGTGDRLPQLQGKPMVKIVPVIPHVRADWYRALDCLVYPVMASGFPMLPLEAALVGCPVAMTPVSDCYQLLQGQFGFFGFKPEAVIEAVQFATSRDQEQVKAVVKEKFSRESFLSGWHVLLS